MSNDDFAWGFWLQLLWQLDAQVFCTLNEKSSRKIYVCQICYYTTQNPMLTEMSKTTQKMYQLRSPHTAIPQRDLVVLLRKQFCKLGTCTKQLCQTLWLKEWQYLKLILRVLHIWQKLSIVRSKGKNPSRIQRMCKNYTRRKKTEKKWEPPSAVSNEEKTFSLKEWLRNI